MKIGTIAWVVFALSLGLFGGWLGKAYVSSRVDNTRSLLELSQAHEVMRSGDIQRAIFHAAQAAALNPKAYLAFLSLAEFYERADHQGLAVENYEEALRLLRAEGGGTNEESILVKKIQQLKLGKNK